LDFYRRCSVLDKIRFFDEYCFVEPGGRISRLKAGMLPAPLHFAASFLNFPALGWRDKLAIARGLRTMKATPRENSGNGSQGQSTLEATTFSPWLDSERQTEMAVRRFWRPVVVSALNEEPERASARAAFQVFQDGLLASGRGYEMGVAAGRRAELDSSALERGLGERVRIHLRTPVQRLDPADGSADYY